jgi:lysophospholipase L1-like esterase
MKSILLFRGLAVVLVLGLGLIAAEWAMRYRENRIAGSDRLDPGLVIYDEELGWKLNPGWRGNHRHHDYAVSYAISSRGYREPDRSSTTSARRWLVVGDSFTFGFGVNADETFVEQLNEFAGMDHPKQDTTTGARNVFVNVAVPGYSTDQEMLLIERELARTKVGGVLLVVYLGNDLLDNPRPTAIQVPLAKPYFEIGSSGLTLRNTPVPRVGQGSGNPRRELRRAVLGDQPSTSPILNRLAGWSAFLRTFGLSDDGMPAGDVGFGERFDPLLELFARLIERLDSECRERGIALRIALLPGRSCVERPNSVSAAYQEHLRSRIIEFAPRFNARIHDLTAELRRAYAENRESFFFPNDGHLTAAGHRKVARMLAADFRG